ncbi:MAG: hypothetical protein HKN87_18900 [Saprospiraceae bacterium]|nr:hypothetical protein [Saprospiraceae bacterium]
MRAIHYVILLLASTSLFCCQRNITDDLSKAEAERVNAFMSGKVMINGTWQTPPLPKNLIVNDYTALAEIFLWFWMAPTMEHPISVRWQTLSWNLISGQHSGQKRRNHWR